MLVPDFQTIVHDTARAEEAEPDLLYKWDGGVVDATEVGGFHH